MSTKAPMMPVGGIKPKVYVRPQPPRVVPYEKPYPGAVVEYSFEYWFNYFYKELKTPEQRQSFYLRISPTVGTLLAADQIADTEKKALLLEMMNIGFKEYEETKKLSSTAMFETLITRKQVEVGRVMFRGDTREPGTIESNLGTKPQTLVDSLAASRNFDKIWHPWNDATRGKKAYFRDGDNQDNCLFSAISVTPEFFVATKFPLFSQLPATAKGTVEVLVEEKAAAATGKVAGIAAFEKPKLVKKTLTCSRTNVYAVKVKKGWDTESFQSDPFPERAYQKLRWIDHFAVLKVIRIHYSGDPNGGHLVLIDSWTMLPDQEDAEWNIHQAMKKLAATNKAVVEQLYIDLKNYLRDIAMRGKLLNGLGGIPYTPPGVTAPFTIKRVSTFTW